MYLRTALFTCALMLPAQSVLSQQAPMTFTLNAAQSEILATGKLDVTTADTFRALLKQQDKLGSAWPITVRLRSDGGSLNAGLQLGRLFRQHQFSIVVDGDCASACAYAAMGGATRQLADGARIGVHQFKSRASDETPAAMEAGTQVLMGMLIDYAQDMGLDSAIISRAAKIPPNEMWWLSTSELVSYKFSKSQEVAAQPGQPPTFASPNVPSVVPISPSSSGELADALHRARVRYERASSSLESTRRQRLAGSCRAAGPLVLGMWGRGTAVAKINAERDEIAHVERCGREAQIQYEDSASALQEFQTCAARWQLETLQYSANCVRGEFADNKGERYRVYASKISHKNGAPRARVNGLYIQMSRFSDGEFLDNSCAGMLEFNAENYMAACDMSSTGLARWAQFERSAGGYLINQAPRCSEGDCGRRKPDVIVFKSGDTYKMTSFSGPFQGYMVYGFTGSNGYNFSVEINCHDIKNGIGHPAFKNLKTNSYIKASDTFKNQFIEKLCQ